MENKIDSKAIGERIKEARSKLKMSQHQLSIATGISTTQLSAYENGKKTIGLLNFSKLAIALNVSMDELYWASPLIHPAATNENYGAIVVNCTLELYEKGIVNQTFIPIGNIFSCLYPCFVLN
jgi:transcriptional regulator with XRE-family HTH domain